MSRTVVVVAALAATAAPLTVASSTPRWQRAADIPIPRTEVAAARHGSEIVVVGGYFQWGDSADLADAYSPRTDRWRRLQPLPIAVNHAMAATWRGRIVIAGGYVARGTASPRVFILEPQGWRELRAMPAPRAAGGAAVIGNVLYVVGGVGTAGLARSAFALDLLRGRWTQLPGPTPREHLAVTAAAGRVYALAGRLRGIDTNVQVLESWRPGLRRWTRHPPIPSARGGTGATTVGRTIVSVGGEEPRGTIASVYTYDTRTQRWRRLPSLPTPRHGLGVVATGKRVYALAGGPRPGLTVSGATEFLTLP
jgi:N-acetylneuraminic acid mutarotase